MLSKVTKVFLIFCAVSAVMTMVGCQENAVPLQRDAVVNSAISLKVQLEQEKQRNKQLQSENKALRGFGKLRGQYLIKVDALTLTKYSRCYDRNKDGIADGINVYLQFRDQENDLFKTAGSATIEFWDLENKLGQHRLMQQHINPEDLQAAWLGGFMTNYFKFVIAWPNQQVPLHSYITIRVKFTEALTGATFEQQKMVSVGLIDP